MDHTTPSTVDRKSERSVAQCCTVLSIALAVDPVVDALVKANTHSLAGARELHSLSSDDVRQELIVGLLARGKSYDPSCGSVRAWAKKGLVSVARDMIRHARRRRRTPPGPMRSLDEAAFNETDSVSVGDLIPAVGEEPLERLIAVERRERVGQVIASLTPHLRELCGALANRSKEEAMTRLQLSRRHFDRDIEDLKQVLKHAGLAPERPDCAHASRN